MTQHARNQYKICGYPNHTAKVCLRKPRQQKGAQFPFPSQQRKFLTPHTDPQCIYNQFYTNNKTKNTQKEKEINVIISLEDIKSLNYISLIFSNNLSRKALIDTGACASALPEKVNRLILGNNPDNVSRLEPMPSSSIKMASGRLLKIIGKCRIKFEFHDEFLVLPAIDRMVLGNPFFKKHDIDFCPSQNLLKLPQMTFHMNEVKGGKKRKILQTPKNDIFCRQKTILQPKQLEIVMFKLERDNQYNRVSGAVIPD